jgi:menaquinol-cytochrome c reductase iron-sulfur subunit
MSADKSSVETGPQSRRTAVQVLTGFLGLLLNLIPVSLGGLFFLDPLIRGRKSGGGGDESGTDGFVKLSINTDAVPSDGRPLAVTVVADHVDAWNKYKDVPIGSIWLRRDADGKLTAFNSICPHLGCSVDYRASNDDFYCPCHTSAFDLNGKQKNEIPPRGMDDLEVFTATAGNKDAAGTEIWVRYRDYLGGKETMIEV